jgi:hypothetical protein
MYYNSIALVLDELNKIRKVHYPNEIITIFYDSGKISSMAGEAFRSLKNDPGGEDIAPYFFTMAPVCWQDCLLLQPADFIAFEGMKRLDGHLNGNRAIRKSFANLLGNKVDIGVSAFTDAYFQELQKRKREQMAAMGRKQ